MKYNGIEDRCRGGVGQGASNKFSNRAKGQIIEVASGHRVKPGSVDAATDCEPLTPWI